MFIFLTMSMGVVRCGAEVCDGVKATNAQIDGEIWEMLLCDFQTSVEN